MSKPKNVPLSSPDIGVEERRAVLAVLRTTRLSMGPKVEEFESAVSAAVGSRFAIAVNSGTSGLHLCVKAAGLGPGDEVITTPFSFVASANCILYEGATPVFADIDPVTCNIDPGHVASRITSRTRAILAVHVFGRPCDLARLQGLADRHRLTLIEDACEALGARYHGKAAGTFGETGVFAFYPNKQITTGEGGIVVTDNAEVNALCRSLRNQGRGEDGGWLEHERLGYNYRLSDINCALGTVQLARLNDILERRAAVARMYSELLSRFAPHLVLPAPDAPGIESSWFVYVVRLPEQYSRSDRDAIIRSLRDRGIGCGAYFSPLHLQPFYRAGFGFRPGDYPATEFVAARTIALPFYNNIKHSQIERVCRTLAGVIAAVKPAYSRTPGVTQPATPGRSEKKAPADKPAETPAPSSSIS